MKIKNRIAVLILTIAATNFQFFAALGQGTAFTYQGRLNDGAGPAGGIYDLRFTIYDFAGAGSVIGGPLTNSATAVSNGLFTISLDFGPSVFTGPDRWLEISARTNGGGAFTTLNPRQHLTAAPYAITAGSVVSGGLPSGTYSSALNLNNPANTLAGNGSALTGLNASGITTGTLPDSQLSANVALRSGVNTFTGDQIITGGTLHLHLGGVVHSAYPFWASVMEFDDYTSDFRSFVGADGLGLTGVTNQMYIGTYTTYPVKFFMGQWERMAINTNGNIGIGTSDPEALLDVNGQAVVRNGLAVAGGVSSDSLFSSGTLEVWNDAYLYGNLSVGGVVQATAFQGDGSGLTNVRPPSQVSGGPLVQAQANMTYNVTSSVPTIVSLPTSANVGDVVTVSGLGTGGWQVEASSGQSITGYPAPTFTWMILSNTGPFGWSHVASSADGVTIIAAASSGAVIASHDRGTNFVSSSPAIPNAAWSGVACSTNGSRIIACPSTGFLYCSTNGGTNWTARGPNRTNWFGVASSADGARMVAVHNGGQIYVSADVGTTWTAFGPSNLWAGVACSANGTRMYAFRAGNQIYTSGNGGTNWAALINSPSQPWNAIACSADGTKIFVATIAGPVWISTDTGNSWASYGPTLNWYGIASSSDGSRVAGSPFGDQIYSSGDGGLTWTASGPNSSWQAIASSASGANLVAGEASGYIQLGSLVPGTSLTGTQGESLALQYVGNGVWQPMNLPTSANLAGATVARDSSGNFSAGTITATAFVGNGSGLSNLNASQISSGTIPDARLSTNVSLLGQSITSSEIADGTIVDADISPSAAISDTKLATISSANKVANSALATITVAGKVADSALSSNVALRSSANTFNGNQVVTNGELDLYGGGVVHPTNPGWASVMGFYDYTGASRAFVGIDGIGITGVTNQMFVGTYDAFPLKFFTGHIERMSIDTNGGVGIGTLTYPGQLTVTTATSSPGVEQTDGTHRIGTYLDSYGGWLRTPNGDKLNLTAGATMYPAITIVQTSPTDQAVGIYQFNPQYTLDINGSLYATTATKPGGGSWSVASDARLKKDVRPLSGALDKLLALRGVTFEYIDPEKIHELSGERMGLIAQEVEKVFPDWVETGKDGYKRVTVRGMEALVPEALRELRDEQNEKIAEIEKEKQSEIDALKQRMEKLERLLNEQPNGSAK
jgi:hypothetical protein